MWTLHDTPVHQELRGFWAIPQQPVSWASLTALCILIVAGTSHWEAAAQLACVMGAYRQRTAIYRIEPVWTCVQ